MHPTITQKVLAGWASRRNTNVVQGTEAAVSLTTNNHYKIARKRKLSRSLLEMGKICDVT